MSKLSQEDSKPKSLPSHVLDNYDYQSMLTLTQKFSNEAQNIEDKKQTVLCCHCRFHNEQHIQGIVPNIVHSPNNNLQHQFYDTHTSNCPLHKTSVQNLVQTKNTFQKAHEGNRITSKIEPRKHKELTSILEEIRFITDKIRNEVNDYLCHNIFNILIVLFYNIYKFISA